MIKKQIQTFSLIVLGVSSEQTNEIRVDDKFCTDIWWWDDNAYGSYFQIDYNSHESVRKLLEVYGEAP